MTCFMLTTNELGFVSDRSLCSMAHSHAPQNWSLRTSVAMCTSDHIRRRPRRLPHLRDASSSHHNIVRPAHVAMSRQQSRVQMDMRMRHPGGCRLAGLDHPVHTAVASLQVKCRPDQIT